MVPSHKAPARQGTFSRSISAQNAPFARSTSAQNVFARTTSGNTLLSPGRRSMIRSPMKQQQQPVRSASITPGRRGEKRRRVDLDVDGIGARDISPVREEGGASYPEREEEFESSMDDGEDDGQEEEEDVWPIDEKEVVCLSPILLQEQRKILLITPLRTSLCPFFSARVLHSISCCPSYSRITSIPRHPPLQYRSKSVQKLLQTHLTSLKTKVLKRKILAPYPAHPQSKWFSLHFHRQLLRGIDRTTCGDAPKSWPVSAAIRRV